MVVVGVCTYTGGVLVVCYYLCTTIRVSGGLLGIVIVFDVFYVLVWCGLLCYYYFV